MAAGNFFQMRLARASNLYHPLTVLTCRRQQRDFISYVQQVVYAWIDRTPAPSLVPAGAQLAPSG